MMRQDRFTEGAQEVLAESQQLVRTERHSQWDVEHVLMALLTHERGIMPALLDKLGVDTGRLRDAVAKSLAKTPKLQYDVVQIYTTPRIVRMLEAANAEAERLKDEYVGIEHILIAIADEREGDSARILRDLGIDKERIYQALQEVRGGARVDSPTAESKYKALEKYSIDLTEAARQGKLDPVIGREDEIRRVMQILNRRTKNNPVFIDELHQVMGAGGAEGAIDASTIMKPALARGEMQCIGATTLDEYRTRIEKDPALERR